MGKFDKANRAFWDPARETSVAEAIRKMPVDASLYDMGHIEQNNEYIITVGAVISEMTKGIGWHNIRPLQVPFVQKSCPSCERRIWVVSLVDSRDSTSVSYEGDDVFMEGPTVDPSTDLVEWKVRVKWHVCPEEEIEIEEEVQGPLSRPAPWGQVFKDD